MRISRLAAALGCLVTAALLAGCGSTIGQRAYALGQTYNIMQDGAITYMETAKPSADVADAIADADKKASAQVQATLKCAEDLKALEEGAPPSTQATALGLSASEVADATEEACEAGLAQANVLVSKVSDTMAGD